MAKTTDDIGKKVTGGAKAVATGLHRYQVIVIALLALALVGYSIYSISNLLNPQLDQAVYDKELSETESISFDEGAIDVIRNLEDPAGPVQSQLPSQRNNPF